MKALVTGGGGFIGSYLVQELENRNYDVVIGDLGIRFDYEHKAKFIQMDVSDKDACKSIIHEMPGVIFHCAGLLGTATLFDRIREAEMTNVIGTLNVLQAAREIGERCVVAQPNLLGDWLNPYMQTKHQAEKYGFMYQENFGVRYISVRPTDVYGPRQHWGENKAAPLFMMKALKGEPIEIYGDGSSWVNYVYAGDVAKFLVDCVEKNGWAKMSPIDFSDPVGDITIMDFAKLIKQFAGSDSEIKLKSMRHGQPGNIKPIGRDLKYAQQIGGMESLLSLEKGIRRSLSWYRGEIYADWNDRNR